MCDLARDFFFWGWFSEITDIWCTFAFLVCKILVLNDNFRNVYEKFVSATQGRWYFIQRTALVPIIFFVFFSSFVHYFRRLFLAFTLYTSSLLTIVFMTRSLKNEHELLLLSRFYSITLERGFCFGVLQWNTCNTSDARLHFWYVNLYNNVYLNDNFRNLYGNFVSATQGAMVFYTTHFTCYNYLFLEFCS